MIKIIGRNSMFLIGKISDVRLQLASIRDKNISLAEYIQQQALLYKNSLN